jgi:hypothetical protein
MQSCMNRILFAFLAAALFLPIPAPCESKDWNGTLSYALLRSRPDHLDEYHDALSVSLAGFQAISPRFSVGAEIGYHGTRTYSGIQCGPEWQVDCPSPEALRAGVWESAIVARVQAELGSLRPYVIAGAGPYLPGDVVVEAREAKIHRHFEPGVTAGAGVRVGFLGVEGRWHYVNEAKNSANEGSNAYDPLRIYSASVCISFP